jgi:hypothetical protein
LDLRTAGGHDDNYIRNPLLATIELGRRIIGRNTLPRKYLKALNPTAAPGTMPKQEIYHLFYLYLRDVSTRSQPVGGRRYRDRDICINTVLYPHVGKDACSSDLKHSYSYIILRHIYLGAGGDLRQVYIIT